MTRRSPPQLTKSHYETLASLRHALRRFLAFSEAAAREEGIPAQQHQALLAIKGFRGRDQVSVGELAEYLHLKHHSAVGLIDRLSRRQLVSRTTSKKDRRQVIVALTPRGEALIRRLSAAHLDELKRLGPELRKLIDFAQRE
jgi:DNA-binding MarR family transcriptional regulator